MGQQMNDLMNLDLGRLNLVGWLLLLATFGIVAGGIALFVLANQEPAAPGARRVPRFVGYLCWVAAAAFFFGGRWVLNAAGVSIYRRARE